MLIADLLGVVERLAPSYLAQPWDNVGLQVGAESAPTTKILAALDLTEAVLAEAVVTGCDSIITHHPLLFRPLRSLVESSPRQRLVRELVSAHMSLIACHTNLDAAPGGLADIAAQELGLGEVMPLDMAPAGWYKLVGFVPVEATEEVAAAVFAAGAGGIGRYEQCAFAVEGTGWFTPGVGSRPAVGEVSQPERTAEMRWETVVPKRRLGAALRAFIAAHPYEEPAFDVYPVEDVLPRVGVGRVGSLGEEMSLRSLAEKVVIVYDSPGSFWSGDGDVPVRRVGVLPGSGRGAIETASESCDVLITGDLGYHDAEQAAESGLALVELPHGAFEWWAFRRWVQILGKEIEGSGVILTLSAKWRAPWTQVEGLGAEEGTPGG